MGAVASLRALSGDVHELGHALSTVAARARRTFSNPPRVAVGTCAVTGCDELATYPCVCEPVLCGAHYLIEIGGG